jgi:hypothetical protein
MDLPIRIIVEWPDGRTVEYHLGRPGTGDARPPRSPPPALAADTEDLKKRLAAYGIREPGRLIDRYSPLAITRVLMELESPSRHVLNPAGWIIKALVRGWKWKS